MTVNWDFLLARLKMSGSIETWCEWIKQVVSGVTVSVKLKNTTGQHIKSYTGVRKGEPLSPHSY